jgi:hypothetical protein
LLPFDHEALYKSGASWATARSIGYGAQVELGDGLSEQEIASIEDSSRSPSVPSIGGC